MKALGVRRATLGAASLSAMLFTSTYFAKASYKERQPMPLGAVLGASKQPHKASDIPALQMQLVCNEYVCLEWYREA